MRPMTHEETTSALFEATDEIARLTARIEQLEAALRLIEGYSPAVSHHWAEGARAIARKALEDKQC